MTVDHVGALLYPDVLWLRLIGRLAMPIIAFLLVEGYCHTHNIKHYMMRLLAFALLAQPIYLLAFQHGLNILFDLVIGLCLIWATDHIRSRWLESGLLVATCAAGIFANLDWWHLGILMIYIFDRTRGNFGRTSAALLSLLVLNFLVFYVISARTGNPNYLVTHAVNLGCFLALPLICRYNGKRGRDYRYFFYVFYPLHLLALYAVKTYWF